MTSSFEAGQVWLYHTRPGEESSRVVVCRVEAVFTISLAEVVDFMEQALK